MKRIFELAKELNVESKAIIAKCVAEGIPAEKVKNHMATISAGLEASIREWFASGSAGGSAVETTEHVDAESIRAKSKRKLPAKTTKTAGGTDADLVGGDEGTSTALAEPVDIVREVAPPPPPPHTPHPPVRPTEVKAPPAPHVTPATTPPVTIEPPPATDVETTESETETSAVPAPVVKATHTPKVPPPPPAPVAPPGRSSAPAGRGPGGGPSGPTTPPAPGSTGPGPGGPAAPGHGTPVRAPSRAAPMNVPSRPKVVAPVGVQLTPRRVALAGPKVVRVEAPDVVDKPRPRRAFDGPGPGAGGGGGGGGGSDDDRRRSGGGSGAGGGAGGGGGAAGRKRPGVTRTDSPRRKSSPLDEQSAKAGGMWREQDLLERENRLAQSPGYLKKRRHELKLRGVNQPGERAATAAQTGGVVKIVGPCTIKDLSAATGIKSSDIIKKLFMQGAMVTANSGTGSGKAPEVMLDFNIELEVVSAKSAEEVVASDFEKREAHDVRSRGPIVTILGHVDHGKTSLLDKIRNANVAAGEAGGITQATSAFRVPVDVGGEKKNLLFLDTPGHEAFTSMRARGAKVTDIIVLVVSAPEGVMPQTIESIAHAKAAGVPLVVALNKVDRPDATDARINQTLSQLADAGLNPIEWGGTTEVVRTSAVKGDGISQLLEILDLQGQMLELKADYAGPARGTVVEARVEEGRGPVANVIVQDGELKVGDFVVIGRAFGKVRDIVDDRGVRHKTVGPAMPVQISGFDALPDAGDKFYIVDSLRKAQEAAEQRRDRERQAQLAQPKLTLDTMFAAMKDAETKEILIVLKADVQGSVDAIRHEAEKIKGDKVGVRVLHSGVGGINESDVLLADASKAIIVGFNVIPSGKARNLAEAKNVEIRSYQVIYDISDDLKKAAEGLLAPELRQEILGHAEVRAVFKVTKVGNIAGCYVTDGSIERNAFIRVTRNGVVIENDRLLEQLKRFKDDAKEVKSGMECGMKIAGYDDIKEGDVLECYKRVEVKRTL